MRDAQGNLLALYTKDASSLKWDEQHLYGSSRVGMARPGLAITTARPNDAYSATADPIANGIEGKRSYELTNHLGNVLATISDRKLAVPLTGNPSQIDYYTAELLSSQDYYTFGMLMPGRNSSSSSYRYGFNGQEKSDEIKGSGNSYTAEFWEYDPRLGTRWNVDPVRVPSFSPYSVFGDNPIQFADPPGNTWVDKVRAKFWSYTHGGGGRVEKSGNGNNWIAYGAQPEDGGISIRRFKDHHFKIQADFKGEVSLGLQGGYNVAKTPFADKIPFLKDVKAKLDVNVFSATLFQGSTSVTYDATANSSSQTSTFSAPAFDYSGQGVLWKHGLGLELGFGKDGNNLIGYKVEHSYRLYSGYYGPGLIGGTQNTEHKGYFGRRSIPFFGDDQAGFKDGGVFPNSPYQVNPRVKTTFEISTKGMSLQTNLNFNFLLKLDGSIKLGIAYE